MQPKAPAKKGVRSAQELPGLFVHTPASQVAWWWPLDTWEKSMDNYD